MVSVHVLTQIALAIVKYSDDVDALHANPSPVAAELNCLEGRGLFGKLFSDWEEFLDYDQESFQKFYDDLGCAVEAMMAPAEEFPDAAHALGSTRFRQEAVGALLFDRDAGAALAALGKMATLA